MKPFLITAFTLGALPYVSGFNPSKSSFRKTALGYQGVPPLVDSTTTTRVPKISIVSWKDNVPSFSTATADSSKFVQKRRRSKVNRESTGPAEKPFKDLAELSLGDWIDARVAVVTPGVGAFVKTDYKLQTNRGYALLPKSQMKANRESISYALPVHAGQVVRVRVIALDETKGEIALSMLPERVALDQVSVGEERQGIVRAIRPYGAFVDVGCQTNGLLHVSRIVPAVERNNVEQALVLGQAVRVRVIGKNEEKNTMEVSMLCAEMDANMDAQNGIQRRRAEV